MIGESVTELKELVVALSEQNQMQTIAISTLVNEVAALRELLKAMNGEQFANDLQQMQLRVMTDTALIESARERLCDAIIQRAKAL